MKTFKSIAFATVLMLSAAQVSFAGTIPGSINRTGTIVGSRTGTIVGSRTGTIVGSRTGTILGSQTTTGQSSEGIIPTQTDKRLHSDLQDEMLFNLMFWLNNFVW